MKAKKKNQFRIASSKQMKQFAGFFAKEIIKNKKLKIDHAFILALTGNLGAGKTIFVQGFLRALGVRGKITSPTFILLQRFTLHASCFTNAYHLDCYRLDDPNEFIKLGIKEILRDPKNIVLIEWAEKIKKLLPRNTIWIKLEHGKNPAERSVRMTAIS